MDNRIVDITKQPVRILNATVGKPYEHRFNFNKLKWEDISSFQFKGLEDVGLHFDGENNQITGVPTKSGDFTITFEFRLKGEAEDADFHEKIIPLIINPDARSLWKNINSDKDDPYWKEDNVTLFAPLGDRHILVSSKRGRAHANVGSFREDDFIFKELDSRWNLTAVADGAGSAEKSRKGSSLACESIVEYFTLASSDKILTSLDELLQQYQNNSSDDIQKKLNLYVYNELGKAVLYVHKKLSDFASNTSIALEDLNSTFIFTLFKKYETGYALLSFGVGDCPIAVLNKDLSEVVLMNWIDVGEFGGGTRFITQPEIFQSDKFATRFGFKFMDDFSYLIMMSDGIYDPKFVVEANLPNIKKWKEFLADLDGNNEHKIKVSLEPGNDAIINQFSAWMDFWSQGNHDDRTLVIIF